MRIGILKETQLEEKRVALTPGGVISLIEHGNQVYIEKDAGLNSHFKDVEFEKVGAKIVYSPEEVFNRSEMIVKVAPFSDKEAELLNPEQIIFSFLFLFMRKKLIEIFKQKKITSIGFEMVENENGEYPFISAMSELAGPLAIQIGARYLENHSQVSRGVLLGGITGVAPAVVVIIGAGTVGLNAARTALGLGAQVVVLDNSIAKLRRIEEIIGNCVTTQILNPYTIERAVKFADVLIGAVLIKGEFTPHIVTKSMVQSMKSGAVIIDISIDQGGCIETSRPTTISNPTYVENNVIHFCVPNIPAMVSRTASYSLNNIIIDYINLISENGLENAEKENPGLAKGICTKNGNYYYE
jgi:alanine dehydrogenase